MERLKIIKELNNVANILEDNGRISEASQITNVLIKIAQGTPSVGSGASVQNSTQPTPGQQPQGQPAQTPQLTPDQIKQNIKTRLNELIRLRSFAENYKKAAPGHSFPKYYMDETGYQFDASGYIYEAKSLEELAAKIKRAVDLTIAIPGKDSSKNEYADKITENIASATNWPDPEGDASITKAINEKYQLGYNLLAGTYYIGSKTNPSDNYDDQNINNLKDVFLKLGEHYKKHNNQFPENIYQATSKEKPSEGLNEIIFNALDRDSNDKFKWLADNYSLHPNYDDIKRGFVLQYNRLHPNNQITESNPHKADANA